MEVWGEPPEDGGLSPLARSHPFRPKVQTFPVTRVYLRSRGVTEKVLRLCGRSQVYLRSRGVTGAPAGALRDKTVQGLSPLARSHPSPCSSLRRSSRSISARAESPRFCSLGVARRTGLSPLARSHLSSPADGALPRSISARAESPTWPWGTLGVKSGSISARAESPDPERVGCAGSISARAESPERARGLVAPQGSISARAESPLSHRPFTFSFRVYLRSRGVTAGGWLHKHSWKVYLRSRGVTSRVCRRVAGAGVYLRSRGVTVSASCVYNSMGPGLSPLARSHHLSPTTPPTGGLSPLARSHL